MQYSVIVRGKLPVNSTVNIFLTFIMACTTARSLCDPSTQQGCTSPLPVLCEQGSVKGWARKKSI